MIISRDAALLDIVFEALIYCDCIVDVIDRVHYSAGEDGVVRLHGSFAGVNDVGIMTGIGQLTQLTALKLSGFTKVD